MNVEMFVTLLFAFSTVTSLLTEASKKFIKKTPIDIVVLIIATIIGCGGMVCYYTLNDLIIGSKDVIFIILMVLANALTAMLGYDKVIEAIKQIKGV